MSYNFFRGTSLVAHYKTHWSSWDGNTSFESRGAWGGGWTIYKSQSETFIGNFVINLRNKEIELRGLYLYVAISNTLNYDFYLYIQI